MQSYTFIKNIALKPIEKLTSSRAKRRRSQAKRGIQINKLWLKAILNAKIKLLSKTSIFE
jgi:hypothetical protein